MGLLLCKTCCVSGSHSSQSIGQQPNAESLIIPSPINRFKILLLGAAGSGKTELGHYLSGLQRDTNDYGSTNGVRYFRVCSFNAAHNSILCKNGLELALTEVGGNTDMQRIWPHYYTTSWALIFCFDMSASSTQLNANIALLESILAHSAMQRKAVLMVATHTQTACCENVQLYDIEHTFGLEELGRRYECALRLCYFDRQDNNVWLGVDWLLRHLISNKFNLIQRIKYDSNMQSWNKHQNLLLANGKLVHVPRQRFRRHRRLYPLINITPQNLPYRPHTAPSNIFSISGSFLLSSSSAEQSKAISSPGRI